MDWIKNNKVISLLLAATTINVLVSMDLSYKFSLSNEKSSIKIDKIMQEKIDRELKEKVDLEFNFIRNNAESNLKSSIATNTEYTISNDNKDLLINQLVKNMESHNTILEKYSILYLKITEQIIVETNADKLEVLTDNRSKIEWEMAHYIDNYNINRDLLRKVFSVDIGQSEKKTHNKPIHATASGGA